MSAPNPASRVEQILQTKAKEWGLDELPAGSSLAVGLLASEEQHLDLANPLGPAAAEAELQQLFLQPAEQSNRVLAWAFAEVENVEQLAECKTPWEAAQFLLQTLMLAIGVNQDPPPLDRE